MASKRISRISMSGRYRWLSAALGARRFMRLERIERSRRPVLAAPFAKNGQILAGTGALVFEGELLELPRRH